MEALKSKANIFHVSCALVVALALATGCAREDSTNTKKIEVGKLDVKDSTIVAAEEAAQTESGNAASIEAFGLHVHPIVTANCAVGCHADVVSPKIAATDAAEAHDTTIISEKINFNDPENSRLVLRLSQDNHNCWSDCAQNASEMLAGIEAWLSAVDLAGTGATEFGITTTEVSLDQLNASTVSDPNPENIIMFDAEAGQRSENGFVVQTVGDAISGSVITTTDGGMANTAAQADGNDQFATVSFRFQSKIAGQYRAYARVFAADNASDSFHIRIDGGELRTWDFRNYTPGTWQWIAVTRRNAPDSQDPNTNQPVIETFEEATLHEMEIIQRENNAQIDAIVWTTEANINNLTFDDYVPQPVYYNDTVEFDLSDILGESNIKFKIVIEDFDDGSYKFHDPYIETEDVRVRVKDIKPLINGKFLPQHSAYTVIDTIVDPPGGESLSPAAEIVLKENGPNPEEAGVEPDKVSFAFGVLEIAPDEDDEEDEEDQ